MQNNNRMKYDVEKLKEYNAEHSFHLTLQTKYQLLQDSNPEEGSIESKWGNIKEVLITAGEEGIGRRKRKQTMNNTLKNGVTSMNSC